MYSTCARCDTKLNGEGQETGICFSCLPSTIRVWYSPEFVTRCNKYGITTDQYAKMYIVQAGRCGICQIKYDNLHIDHDHKTGKVRGLLCMKCNTGLGQLGDTYSSVEQALRYLTNEALGCSTTPPPPKQSFKKQSQRRGPSKAIKERRRKKQENYLKRKNS